jgi:hypothetical protein
MSEEKPTKEEMPLCSCGFPRSFPIPHEHDRTFREQQIINYYRDLIEHSGEPRTVTRERVENLVFDTYGYHQTLKEKMGIIEKFLADLEIEVEEKKP